VLRRAEIAVVAAAIAVVIVLAITDLGSEQQQAERRDVEAVQRAAERLGYQTVRDAWEQASVGANSALTSIVEAIDVRYLSTYQDGDAVILTFQGRSGACIDLVSRPAANTVEIRDC
jgi:hypothetical protein